MTKPTFAKSIIPTIQAWGADHNHLVNPKGAMFVAGVEIYVWSQGKTLIVAAHIGGGNLRAAELAQVALGYAAAAEVMEEFRSHLVSLGYRVA